MKILIKEYLREKNLTSAWLAKKVNISTVAMSNIVTGKNAPSLENMVKIADALEVTLDELIDRKTPQERKRLVELKLDEQEFMLVCNTLQEKIENLKRQTDNKEAAETAADMKESLLQDTELLTNLLKEIQESPYEEEPNLE